MTTLRYTHRQAMPVGTYRVQSPGFPKIVYLGRREGGWGGGGGNMEVGEEGDYTPIATPLSHHQNDSCIKIGSEESGKALGR